MSLIPVCSEKARAKAVNNTIVFSPDGADSIVSSTEAFQANQLSWADWANVTATPKVALRSRSHFPVFLEFPECCQNPFPVHINDFHDIHAFPSPSADRTSLMQRYSVVTFCCVLTCNPTKEAKRRIRVTFCKTCKVFWSLALTRRPQYNRFLVNKVSTREMT